MAPLASGMAAKETPAPETTSTPTRMPAPNVAARPLTSLAHRLRARDCRPSIPRTTAPTSPVRFPLPVQSIFRLDPLASDGAGRHRGVALVPLRIGGPPSLPGDGV